MKAQIGDIVFLHVVDGMVTAIVESKKKGEYQGKVLTCSTTKIKIPLLGQVQFTDKIIIDVLKRKKQNAQR